jgi:LDH2 family malate/lactate/ureidoglycolate dehydrogenase
MLHDCPPLPGAERVLVPGEPEWTEEAIRRAEGIPINQAVIDDLQATASELEIPFVEVRG